MKKGFQWMALLVVAMLGACSGGSDKAAAEKVDEKPRVKLAEVSSRPVEQIQEYTATVEAEVKNNIAPSSPVRIDRIFVEVGDRVSKGQKLVSMDAANLKQIKYQLDNQQIEFKRIDELYKVGGASKSEWDAAKMNLDIRETSYKNLLENTSLLSPINGVVTARNYDNGDMYSGGEPVLVVEQITPVKLYINVSEGYFTRLFKKYTHTTPARFLTDLKLEAACVHLASGCTVTEAAQKTGLDNISHFIRLFKQKYGITPKAYQKGVVNSSQSARLKVNFNPAGDF